MRENAKELNKQYDKSENDLKALQSVGQVCYKINNKLNSTLCVNKNNNYPQEHFV